MARLLWIEVPVRTAAVAPSYASGLTDGQYLLRWPVAPWLAPMLAVVAGVVLERHPFEGGFVSISGEVFVSSSLVMAVLFSIGVLSVQLGSYAFVAYVAADQLTGRALWAGFRVGEWWLPFTEPISAFTEYALLGLGTIGLPMFILAVRVDLRRRGYAQLIGPAGERFIHIMLVGLAYFAWCQTTITAIGTVFTSVGRRVPAEALVQVQDRWLNIVAPVLGAVMARWLLERLAYRPESIHVLRETTERFTARAKTSEPRFGVRVVAEVVLGLVLLGGIIEHWWQTLVTLAVFVGTAFARRRLGRTRIGRWLARFPILTRIVVAIAFGFVVLSVVSRPSTDSFLFEQGFGITWAAVLTVYTITTLLTTSRHKGGDEPPGHPDLTGTGPPSNRAVTTPHRSDPNRRPDTGRISSRHIAATATALLVGAIAAFPTAAAADDCSSPSDCFGASQSALLAIGLLLLVLAAVLIAAPALAVTVPMLTSSGLLIGASVTIPAGALTAAGIGSGALGATIIGTELGDTIVQATDAGKNEPHGDSGRRLQAVEAQIAELEAQLAELNRTQGPKKEKKKVRDSIERARKNAERARRGETHGRRSKRGR